MHVQFMKVQHTGHAYHAGAGCAEDARWYHLGTPHELSFSSQLIVSRSNCMQPVDCFMASVFPQLAVYAAIPPVCHPAASQCVTIVHSVFPCSATVASCHETAPYLHLSLAWCRHMTSPASCRYACSALARNLRIPTSGLHVRVLTLASISL